VRQADRTAEERVPGIALIKVLRDAPAVRDDVVAVHEHRDRRTVREGDPLLVREAPRHFFAWQPLVPERHLDAPAVRAETHALVGAGQVVQSA
jgi:hypothetical protein